MEWISVKDELPTDGQDVFCFWKCIIGEAIDGENYNVARYENYRWLDCDEFSDKEYNTPTHWMPLPNPPQGETK